MKNQRENTKEVTTKDVLKRQMLTESLQLFSLKGFDSVTFRDIGEKCGCRHSLINYYFGNKFDLWKSAVSFAFKSCSSDFVGNELFDKGLVNHNTLKALIENFVYFCAERPQIQRIMVLESIHQTERFEWIIDN